MAITGLIADKNMNPITDPSPTDAVEDLKNLDDNTLAKFAQDRNNPNATYALVVLMQRKKARDTMKKDMPQGTVAQEVSQDVTTGGINTPQPNPEQLTSMGVGALPADNIGQNYAGGGIVSFQAGGMPVLDPSMKSPYTSYYPDMRGYNSAIRAQERPGGLGRVRDALFGGLTKRFGEMTEARQRAAELKQEKAQLQNLMNKGELPRESYYPAIERIKAIDAELATPIDQGGGGYEPTESPKLELEKEQPTVEKPKLEEQKSVFEGQEDIDPQTNAIIDEVSKEQGKGIDLLGQADRLENKYAQDRIEDKSTEDYFKEVGDMYDKMGVEKNLFGDLQKDLERDKQQLGKARGEAADIALIEAGLMIAGGKSQNALTNLAEAAPAIRNYANERRALRGEERSIRDAEFKIKAADASARQGQADKAIAMMMDNRKLNAQIDTANLDRASREKVAELNRQTNLKIQELTNMKPTEFDKKLREAKDSGQYKQPNGEFDMKAFLEDLRFSGSGSASLQKAIMEQYELSDEKANGMSFPDYFRERMAAFGQGTQGTGGLNTNLFPGFSATLK